MRNLILSMLLFTVTFINAQNTQAYVAPGDLRTFLDYNLGADTSLSATTPSLGIKGDKYQYGKITPVDASSWTSPISPDGAWSVTKTATDPCPSGYRVPTAAEWQGVIDNNTIQWVGDFIEDGTNVYNRHSSGLLINNSMFLPAAGTNVYYGNLFGNNASGTYWATDATGWGNYAKGLSFTKSLIGGGATQLIVAYSFHKNSGLNVRCIQDISSPLMILGTQESTVKKEIKFSNPSKDYLNVVNSGKNKKVGLEVYDMITGKLVLKTNLKETHEKVSIGQLAKNTYVIKFLVDDKVYSNKLIVE